MQIIAALVTLLVAPAAQALDPDQMSRSAVMVACWRAATAHDPNPQTRNPDHLAEKLLDAELLELVPSACRDVARPFEEVRQERLRNPTAAPFFGTVSRTKHIDATLTAGLDAGAKQVVILGAGFDTRAYRLGEGREGVRFFEVDSPATQADKKQRIRRIFGALPRSVVYVSVDFETQSIEERLLAAGFQREVPSFFVWEGVTMYLSAEAIEATLQSVRQLASPGSGLIFNYILASVIEGTYPEPEAVKTMRRKRFKAWGEPWLFGIAEGGTKDLLAPHGFELVSDLGQPELFREYLGPAAATEILGDQRGISRIVHARVPE